MANNDIGLPGLDHLIGAGHDDLIELNNGTTALWRKLFQCLHQ